MSDPLQQLEEWAAPLLQKLGPAEQRQITRKIATELRRSQVRRIGQQRNPDGSKYAAGKKARPPVNKPRRFLYEGDYSSKKRVAEVKSYRDEGRRIIGYDIEAGGIRTFIESNMIRSFAPTSKSGPSIKPKRKRTKAMFRRMRTKIKLLSDPGSATIGIVGRSARIARVHQYGLRDAVRPGGPTVQYPERELLGFTEADREKVRDLLLEHLAK